MAWEHDIGFGLRFLIIFAISEIVVQHTTHAKADGDSLLCSTPLNDTVGELDVEENGNISLPCITGTKLQQDYTLTWRMGTGDTVMSFSLADGEIPSPSKTSSTVLITDKQTHFTLQIIGIKTADSGQYFCEMYWRSQIFCEVLNVSVRVYPTNTFIDDPDPTSPLSSASESVTQSTPDTTQSGQSALPLFSTRGSPSITTFPNRREEERKEGSGHRGIAYRVFTALLPSSIAGSVIVGTCLLIFFCRKFSDQSRKKEEKNCPT